MEYEAIGVFEVKYYTTALQVTDAICKSANVELITSEKKLGGRLVTIIIGGTVSDVKEAVDAAKECCEGMRELLKMNLIITRPHKEIMKFIVPKQVDLIITKPHEEILKATKQIEKKVKTRKTNKIKNLEEV